MRNVNPFVGLFVAMATLMAAFFVPVFVLLVDHGERLAAVEATVAAMRVEHGERMARFEARMDGLEAAIAALARDMAALNERMARIEGAVAGALGRPFPERMAEGPDNPGAEG